mgnify:CR=1 FL=1
MLDAMSAAHAEAGDVRRAEAPGVVGAAAVDGSVLSVKQHEIIAVCAIIIFIRYIVAGMVHSAYIHTLAKMSSDIVLICSFKDCSH